MGKIQFGSDAQINSSHGKHLNARHVLFIWIHVRTFLSDETRPHHQSEAVFPSSAVSYSRYLQVTVTR